MITKRQKVALSTAQEDRPSPVFCNEARCRCVPCQGAKTALSPLAFPIQSQIVTAILILVVLSDLAFPLMT